MWLFGVLDDSTLADVTKTMLPIDFKWPLREAFTGQDSLDSMDGEMKPSQVCNSWFISSQFLF